MAEVSELIGAELDAAVAKALGGVFKESRPWEAWDEPPRVRTLLYVDGQRESDEEWTPSTDWSQGGPIIDRERIWMLYKKDGEFMAVVRDPPAENTVREWWGTGPTYLIAAMRAFVASKK